LTNLVGGWLWSTFKLTKWTLIILRRWVFTCINGKGRVKNVLFEESFIITYES